MYVLFQRIVQVKRGIVITCKRTEIEGDAFQTLL